MSFFDLIHRLVPSLFVFKISMSFLMLTIMFAIEACVKGYQNSAFKRIVHKPSKSAKLDIACALLFASGLAPIIGVVLSFGFSHIAPICVKKWFGYELLSLIKSEFFRFLIYILLIDFVYYWKHRLSHHFNWWWQVHQVHHSATELNIITSSRVHPFDVALMHIFTCVPIALAGTPPSAYLTYLLFRNVLSRIQHSDMNSRWGWVGKYLFVSPAQHRVHHSILPEHLDKNFGNFTPLWDHIFGTWCAGSKDRHQIGISNNSFNHKSWYVDLCNSYTRFWSTIYQNIFIKRTLANSSKAKHSNSESKRCVF
ncbi:MAG: sterol desaturase/sphingolipid hydroxylase (fatty acid hydroxylase superfamily) [Candidatus Omnitrophota bacterium]|jgi:sterol desaturase/sphingolipid hydroxylase (fatty acid hydroxylase superfamily)